MGETFVAEEYPFLSVGGTGVENVNHLILRVQGIVVAEFIDPFFRVMERFVLGLYAFQWDSKQFFTNRRLCDFLLCLTPFFLLHGGDNEAGM